MASPKPLLRWSILILRSNKTRALGDVEATSEAETIAKGAEEIQEDPKGRSRVCARLASRASPKLVGQKIPSTDARGYN